MAQNLHITLITPGSLVSELHYGPYSFFWWAISSKDNSLFPIKLGQQTKVCLNREDFILKTQTGFDNTALLPVYFCQSGSHTVIENSSTKAISTVYKRRFNTSTRYSGYQTMGWNDNNILEILKQDIEYTPVTVNVGNYKIFVYNIGISSREKWCYAGPDFQASLIHTYEKKQSIYVSRFEEKKCIVEIYQECALKRQFIGTTPDEHQLWTKSPNGQADKAAFSTLYKRGFLTSIPKNMPNATRTFWTYFKQALANNKKGPDGKQRVLSIIANEFTYEELKQNLNVGRHTILESRIHARTSIGYGAPTLVKPIIHRQRFTPEMLEQIDRFLNDKEFVNMSLYKTDTKTGKPIKYLQDTKKALWQRFSEEYPNGMRHTSFMTCLEGGQYVYRENLGGLCSTCNDCGYMVFGDIGVMISAHITDELLKKRLLVKSQELRRYICRQYSKEMEVTSNGIAISQAIKRYVKFGYDVNGGNDIEFAIKDIAGAHIANLNPNCDNDKAKLGTITGISNLQEWTWPTDEEKVGYIYAHALPGIGEWKEWSPEKIEKIVKKRIIEKPNLTFTPHTQSTKQWTMSVSNNKEDQTWDELNPVLVDLTNLENVNNRTTETKSQLIFTSGWTLKEKEKTRQRDPIKRMSPQVKHFLESMFHTGTANPRQKLTAQQMQEELLRRAELGEIEENDVPKVSTITNWISTFSRKWKEAMALRSLEENEN
ncbi:unnamed protein product [Rhizophagus irregularis]|nr:unnamed protein product [Rhizophagus irregularis]